MDCIRVTGLLSIYEVDPSITEYLVGEALAEAERAGLARLTLCQRNLIVNQGLQVFSRQLGGNAGAPQIGGAAFADINDITVASMYLGTASSPPTPAPTDTTVITPVYTPVLVVTYPTLYSIQFGGLLPSTEGNGSTFTQEQLILKNGLLFAEKTFSQVKTSSYGLQFVHGFSFALA